MHEQHVEYRTVGSIPPKQMRKDPVNAAASVSAKMNAMQDQDRSIKFTLRHQSNNSVPLPRPIFVVPADRSLSNLTSKIHSDFLGFLSICCDNKISAGANTLGLSGCLSQHLHKSPYFLRKFSSCFLLLARTERSARCLGMLPGQFCGSLLLEARIAVSLFLGDDLLFLFSAR